MPELALALLAIIPLMSVELSKTLRWQALFGVHRPPYSACLRALVAGQLTNALSPVRAGEAVRLGLAAAQGAPFIPAAGALAGAKAIDAVSLAAIAVAVVGTAAVTGPRLGLLAGAVVISGGLILTLKGHALRTYLERNWATRRLRLAALVDVADTLHDRQTVLVVLTTTIVVWGAGLASNGIVLAAVGISPTFNLMGRVLVAGYIVGIVPAPPARLGVFEAGIAVALTTAGIPLGQAVAAAVTLHTCQLAELALLMAAEFVLRRRVRVKRVTT